MIAFATARAHWVPTLIPLPAHAKPVVLYARNVYCSQHIVPNAQEDFSYIREIVLLHALQVLMKITVNARYARFHVSVALQ